MQEIAMLFTLKSINCISYMGENPMTSDAKSKAYSGPDKIGSPKAT